MSALTVRALMSSPVIAVAPDTPLPQIKRVLHAKNIRRVPVIERGRLVGIITLGDVRNASPSDATTLSIYEVCYLLDQVRAKDIMRTEVVTISAEASVAEAAQAMLTHKVGGLPVVDGTQVVGLITESDLFRALVAGSVPLPRTVAVVTREREAALTAAWPVV